MADTLTLDTAVHHVLGRGGRACLIGDDRQLGAVGGGILTDLDAGYGAVRLTRLHRFADPDEAAATLQVRAGNPGVVDFYLTRDRIRVGDPASLPDRVLAGWQHDQDRGLDALMLAPSRHQVVDLNQRARASRLSGCLPTVQVEVADGNQASTGDVIITRRNDRRLTSGTSWVRNGDRWTITDVSGDGALRVTHRRTKKATLPTTYVQEAVELGYATTIHAAQGVTADTMHGLVDELMTREQLYTMISRGRTANHLYVTVGGDVEPHRIFQPDTQELTADDVLQRVLSRTGHPVSATTVHPQQQRDPINVRSRSRAWEPNHAFPSHGPAAPAR